MYKITITILFIITNIILYVSADTDPLFEMHESSGTWPHPENTIRIEMGAAIDGKYGSDGKIMLTINRTSDNNRIIFMERLYK